ncbi:GNAT family N-acetyltransferase [Streptoalloteichus tenebrarius]|uniref:GNAT family N-acetyltransferase n=1 Tax=Streptoalloteichus tenebrarius (strain ATCC 17920 / DSM 40477 / JCM 4838 / CBS 697.72 / NBRC 16177 / NCIMB 11028 / NRRL B-12390 / A12253. 1 / ISP 5477) TaxID=1933 RepID=UPI0020A41A0C|nr:GNAT family N-acetyltransferase [Streptoalloteichus tenebrarius]
MRDGTAASPAEGSRAGGLVIDRITRDHRDHRDDGDDGDGRVQSAHHDHHQHRDAPDGVDTNGTDTNGADTNGADTNGADTNGADTNGADTNGADTNGVDTNGADAWVRPVTEEDRQFVRALFAESLPDHYSGDHVAHADRVLDAHLAGGVDQDGHFSLQQRMFVLADARTCYGVVHLVCKRQRTVKISPLLVSPSYRGRLLGGYALLAKAEDFARAAGARQLYCTVSETNPATLRFMRLNGFVVAGSAYEQYKPGVREFMLYKVLNSPEPAPERDGLTVRDLVDADVPAMSELVLAAFEPVCVGLGQDWVDALVRAYRRRHTRDLNQKYRDIHVVVDRDGRLRGVAATGPKKGGSIKVVPLCATDPAALSELLTRLPGRVCPDGGRMYSHQPPDPTVTRVLQAHGWSVDALLPGAYRDDQCMVQWSRCVEDAGASTRGETR